MEKSLQALTDIGGSMTFDEFMTVARSNRENGALWLRLKHAGVIEAYFNADGILIVGLVGAPQF